MSLFKIFDVAGSGVSAQSQRLNVVASNLANAESATGPDGKPYRARQVVFQSMPIADQYGSGQRRQHRRARVRHRRGQLALAPDSRSQQSRGR